MTIRRLLWNKNTRVSEDEALAYALAECGLRPGPRGMDGINSEIARDILEYVFSENWIKEEENNGLGPVYGAI